MAKISVPEGMINAAISASADYLRDNQSRDVHAQVVVEAALRWLSENPIVPTYEQYSDLSADSTKYEYALPSMKYAAIEWQRRMFLAPPEPIDTREMTVYDCLDCKKSWKQDLREKVAQCVYCQSANTKAILTMSAVREFTLPEPEVPEEIKDLLFSPKTHASHGEWTLRADMPVHEIVLEAFRRGQQSKS